MKAKDIILHLMEHLPVLTDKFSDYIVPDDMSISGNTVIVTKTAHGLVENQILCVTGSRILNPIASTSEDDTILICNTTGAHDLTQGYQEKVRITSVSTPAIDGDYTLAAVPNRMSFDISGFPLPAPGDLVLEEDRAFSVNGLFPISVIDTDSFSYTLPHTFQAGSEPSIDPSSARLHNQLRISGASSIERAIENYDAQPIDTLWGYVILGDNTTNKDSRARSDAEMEQGNQNEWNGYLRSVFSFFTIETVNKTTGRSARDVAEEVRPPLFSSLLGVSFPTGFTYQADSAVFPARDGAYEYKKSYYIHEFEFGQVVQIASTDTMQNNKTSAFRNLQIDFENVMTDNGEIIASAEVNLDEEP
jgi:hypothetical protein